MERQRINLILAVAILALAGVGLHYLSELVSIGAAYKAKVLCSGVFVSKRSPEVVINGDLAVDDLAILRPIDVKVDLPTQTTSSNFLGLIRQTAAYRPGLGCTLVFSGGEYREPAGLDTKILADVPVNSRWPEERPKAEVVEYVKRDILETAFDWAFSEPDSEHLRRTRAVVVVYKGQIVGERYAPGFDQNTPLIGWSMTKSVMHALVGVLIEEGRLSLTDQVQAPEWREPKNGRSTITLAHLLQMTSGLNFDEDYTDPLADVTYMLLRVPDMASYAARKKLVAEPGNRWNYSSGDTNILSRVIRNAVGDFDYPSFPRRALFHPLGMDSAVLEPDASGTFVGSSYMYATARDWAKFGLLYLWDGVWSGQRILPKEWVRHATTPAPRAPDQAFGAHFWLKIPDEYASGGDATRLPKDAFHAVGHEGQFVTIIPSRELVIVRLGLSRFASAWQHDTFVNKVLEAVRY